MKDAWADECNVDLEMCVVCRFVGGMRRNTIHARKKVPYVWVTEER